jgi:hypothetical protein
VNERSIDINLFSFEALVGAPLSKALAGPQNLQRLTYLRKVNEKQKCNDQKPRYN